MLTEQACNAYSLVSVPLYDTLGLEAISFILTQTELRLVVCDTVDKALQLLEIKSSIEYIVLMDAMSDELASKAAELNIKLMSFDMLKETGAAHMRAPIPAQPSDLATICYTSGTTGTPKGAMLTHANIVSMVSSCYFLLHNAALIEAGKERYISYLPLAHMYERVAQASMVAVGGRIAFFQQDIKFLLDALKEVKPTVFCTVPRLLNRIYAKVNETVEHSSPFKKTLFKWAFANKEREVLQGIVRSFFHALERSVLGALVILFTTATKTTTTNNKNNNNIMHSK